MLLLFAAAPAAAAPLAARTAACFACHGRDGSSSTPGTPSLGGQPAFFVIAQLFLFREGRRANEAMIAAAKGLSDDDLRSLADLIGRLPPPAPPSQPPERARAVRGRALAQEHRCGNCHRADYSGGEQVPRLAAQREDYLLKSLRDYKSGARIGYGNAAMAEVVTGLADADLADLAHFLAHFPAGTRK